MLLELVLLLTSAHALGIGDNAAPSTKIPTPTLDRDNASSTSASVTCASATAAVSAAAHNSGITSKATIFFIVVNAISMAINAVVVYSHVKHKRRKKRLEEELKHKQDIVEEQKSALRLELLCKRGELDQYGRWQHAKHGCQDCAIEVYRSFGVHGGWIRRHSMPRAPPETHEGDGGMRESWVTRSISDASTLGRHMSVEPDNDFSCVGTEQTKRTRSWKSNTLLRKKTLGLGVHDRWPGGPEVHV